MQPIIHNPSLANVALATAELILTIQAEFPEAKIKALPPMDDEEVNLQVWLPIPLEQRLAIQRRMAELSGDVQDKHDVYADVAVLPFSDSLNSNPT